MLDFGGVILTKNHKQPCFLAGYEGAWMDNGAHGHGTFTESSGTSYEGEV